MNHNSANENREAKAGRTDWSTAPTVFVMVAVCPKCGHEKYDRVRTNANGDGTATKLCRCRACEFDYKICEEIPVSGNNVAWV